MIINWTFLGILLLMGVIASLVLSVIVIVALRALVQILQEAGR